MIYGSAGDGLGQLLKGATIVVRGNEGDNAGFCMVSGRIVIVGNAGSDLGNWIIGDSIYIGGDYESLGNNARVENSQEMTQHFFNQY